MIKAVEPSRLGSGGRRAVEIRQMSRRYTSLRRHLLADTVSHPDSFGKIVTRSRRMQAIFVFIESIAPSAPTCCCPPTPASCWPPTASCPSWYGAGSPAATSTTGSKLTRSVSRRRAQRPGDRPRRRATLRAGAPVRPVQRDDAGFAAEKAGGGRRVRLYPQRRRTLRARKPARLDGAGGARPGRYPEAGRAAQPRRGAQGAGAGADSTCTPSTIPLVFLYDAINPRLSAQHNMIYADNRSYF